MEDWKSILAKEKEFNHNINISVSSWLALSKGLKALLS